MAREKVARQQRASRAAKPRVKKRMSYDQAFKLHVVQAALQRPVDNRIKPTCALFPGIEPCQLRKWIRNFEGSQQPPAGTAPKRPTSAAPPSPKRQRRSSSTSTTTASKPARTASRQAARVVVPEEEEDEEDDEMEETEEVEEAEEDEEGAESEDGHESDGASSDTNVPPSEPPSPSGRSERSDSIVSIASAPDREGTPLLSSRNASLTPDKGHREVSTAPHGDSFQLPPNSPPQMSNPLPQMLAMPVDQAAPMSHRVHSAPRYEGAPLYVAPGYGVHSAAADPACASLLNVLADDPVEEWVDEWLREVAPGVSHESNLPCMRV